MFEDLEGRGYKLLEEICGTYFKDKCQAGSIFSRQVGNIYTGSLYLNLASFLANSVEKVDEVVG